METYELTGWADRVGAHLQHLDSPWIDRVSVLAVTASTQDAALQMAAGRPGLLVLAGRQTAGRGRLGRVWSHIADLGVAATFAVDAAMVPQRRAALATGLAAARAVQALLAGVAEVGIRWPNDIVERTANGPGRKLSGVLIEARDGLLLIGVGINVGQRESDWPSDLRARAVSLRQLGSSATRIEAIEHLVTEMDRALRAPAAEVVEAWKALDLLRGRRCTFLHDAKEIHGVVESMEPTLEIVIRGDAGEVTRLPAASTSLVLDSIR